MAQKIEPLVDIAIVVAVSALAAAIEDLANAWGWIAIGPEARGVGAVLGGAAAAIAVVLIRGGSLRDLGLKQPRRWTLVPLQVAAILIVFIGAQLLIPQALSLFVSMPEPDFSRYDAVAGNLANALTLALLLPLTASIPEEIIYRGFLIGRLSAVFGWDRGGAIMSVLVQALLFSAVHFMWGIGGMLMTLIMGLIWGTAYLLC
ncbi:MAG: CPBP family intramembrane metalloprotease, partial [Pseudomonadales bacterium]|nr:CPBP family intramembrane metalloprotease [Pseudomonadales bacterium]